MVCLKFKKCLDPWSIIKIDDFYLFSVVLMYSERAVNVMGYLTSSHLVVTGLFFKWRSFFFKLRDWFLPKSRPFNLHPDFPWTQIITKWFSLCLIKLLIKPRSYSLISSVIITLVTIFISPWRFFCSKNRNWTSWLKGLIRPLFFFTIWS